MKERDNVRRRCIDKHFFFDKSEAQSLTRKAKKAGLTEAALVRSLVSGYEPKEKPDDRFYDGKQTPSALSTRRNMNARLNCCNSFSLRYVVILFCRIG